MEWLVVHLTLSTQFRNGKTDKRKLQQLALDSLHDESDSSTIEESSVEPESPPAATSPALPTPLPKAYIQDHHSSKSEHKSSSVTEVNSEISSVSKEEVAWAGYEDDVIPDKTQPKSIRNLRHRIFTLYRRLFGIVFTINMSIFIWLCTKGADAQRIGGIVIVNLFCAILMRQEYVINAFFNTFCAVPPSWVLTSPSLSPTLISCQMAHGYSTCMCEGLSHRRTPLWIRCFRRNMVDIIDRSSNQAAIEARQGLLSMNFGGASDSSFNSDIYPNTHVDIYHPCLPAGRRIPCPPNLPVQAA